MACWRAQIASRVLPRGCLHRAGQLGVGRQRPVDVPVSAQVVGQHDRIATIGFPPGLPVPLTVPSRGPGIDRKQRESRCDQRGHEQPFVRLDRDLNPGRFTVVILGQQLQQLAEPSRVIGDTVARDDPGLGYRRWPRRAELPTSQCRRSWSTVPPRSHARQDSSPGPTRQPHGSAQGATPH